ncbi:hypothetical protein OTU49_013101, partial [Cherax quadricarinatus]
HNVVTSDFPDIELTATNLTSHVLKDAAEWPDHVATECAVTGRRYTYSQLVDRVARWAGMLTQLGISKGDVVAIIMLNCPEYPIAMLGGVSIGATVTVVNTAYTPEETLRQLQDSRAKLVIGDITLEKKIETSLVLYKMPTILVMNGPSSISGALNLREILEDTSLPFKDCAEVTGEEVALMPYSSGTTGNPKGVSLSHRALAANVNMIVHPSVFVPRETTESYQESFLCYLPFFHIYGILVKILVGLRRGIKLVCVPKFNPDIFVKDVKQHKVRLLHTVPSVLNFLNHSPWSTPEALASVDAVLCGAAPVLATSATVFREKIKKHIFFQEGYGLTEVLITNLTPLEREKIGWCGLVLPGVSAKIIDTLTGQILSHNQSGEICIKSPTMMSGYFHNKEATAATIDSEGWLHTGDIGCYDEQGYFTILDRTKEMIKVKALQVVPSELENVILKHPNVVEVGVVGVPDDRLGEAPRAYVVVSAPTSEAEIKEFVERKVAPYKKLVGGVVFVKEIPKNATGKLLRRELKKIALK